MVLKFICMYDFGFLMDNECIEAWLGAGLGLDWRLGSGGEKMNHCFMDKVRSEALHPIDKPKRS